MFVPMIELEIKVPCPDLEALEIRLVEMGARLAGDLDQEDFYFSHPSRDFGATDEALRLRRENDRSRITYKGPKLDRDTKMREEIELDVEDLIRMSQVLERVGFIPHYRVVKRRRVYILQGIQICLDRVVGLGDFVEMEYEGQDLEEGKRKIMELKHQLNLEGNERRSYLELLMEKK
jgi:adenylate cyclase class 2